MLGMLSNGGYWYYASLVVLVGGALAWLISRRLKKLEESRQRHVEEMQRFDAVRTESPVRNPNQEARERALGSIETRFSLIRGTLIPILIAITGVLTVVPLLEDVPATFLSLLVAAIGVVIGVAARPFLENFICGLVITFSKPFRLGDTVMIDGNFGTIEDITVTHTVVKIWDWRRLMIPNQQMISKEFINYSMTDRYVWAWVEFHVEAAADLDLVRSLAISAAKTSSAFSEFEEPRFWVMELGRDSTTCWVAAWAESPSASWQLKHEIRTKLASDLHSHGIRTHLHSHELFPPELLSPKTGKIGE